jgi:hypothetical protein
MSFRAPWWVFFYHSLLLSLPSVSQENGRACYLRYRWSNTPRGELPPCSTIIAATDETSVPSIIGLRKRRCSAIIGLPERTWAHDPHDQQLYLKSSLFQPTLNRVFASASNTQNRSSHAFS